MIRLTSLVTISALIVLVFSMNSGAVMQQGNTAYWKNFCVLNDSFLHDVYAHINFSNGDDTILKVSRGQGYHNIKSLKINSINVYRDNDLKSAIPQKTGDKNGVTYLQRKGGATITAVITFLHPTHIWDLKTTVTYNNMSLPGC